MTVSNTTRKAGPYSGNGVTTQFAFAFKVFKSDQVTVTTSTDGGSSETTLTLGTDYTVTLGSDAGGTVTLASALPTGNLLAITSNVPYEQPMVLTNKGGFYPTVLNDNADLQCAQIQQLKEGMDRTIKVPAASTKTAQDYAAELFSAEESAKASATAAAASATLASETAATVVNVIQPHLDEIDAVAGHVDNVDTVAGSIASVNTDAASINQIRLVAGDLGAEVEATFLHDFGTYGSDDTNPELDSTGNIAKVASDLTNIDTVAGSISNVDSVAADLSNIDTVVADKTNVDAVVANKANIDTVAGAVGSVNTVAGSIGSVNSVAVDLANIDAAVADKANIDAVAGDLDNINNAQSYANEASASAASAAASETQSGNFATAARGYKDTASTAALEAKSALSSAQSAQSAAESARDTAKGYSDSASESASSAQTTLEEVQSEAATITETCTTNATENVLNSKTIFQLKGTVAAQGKEITYMRSMLAGNLFDWETDSDESYSKIVPSSIKLCEDAGVKLSYGYAGLKSLGGKSIVWNQLNDNSTSNESANGVTFSFNATTGAYTISGTPTARSYRNFVSGKSRQIGSHKLLLTVGNGTELSSSGLCFRIYGHTSGGTSYEYDVTSSHAAIVTTASGLCDYYAYIDVTAGLVGQSISYTIYPQIFDLTLMFGSGNEPTVAEFESMFPENFYAYDSGTVSSALVTKATVVGKNRFNPNKLNCIETYYLSSWESTPTITEKTLSEVQSDEVGWYSLAFDVEGLDSVAVSGFYLLGGGVSSGIFDRNFTALTVTGCAESNKVWTIPTGAKWLVIGLHNQTCIDWSKSTPQIEVGSAATSYVSYTETTLEIPAEVQALDGYGWSCGDAVNEIDFEAKKFIQRVGRIDLGTATVEYKPVSGHTRFQVSADVKTVYEYTLGNAICTKYSLDTYHNVYANSENKTFCVHDEVGIFWIVDSDLSSVDAFKSANSGVYIYFELAEPVETDISDWITDDTNKLTVEPSGSITFIQQDDTKHLPVPSSIEYKVPQGTLTTE